MPAPPTVPEVVSSPAQVHVIGAGPVGLLLTALLQQIDDLSVTVYEKRSAYTRTRMVQLASYLLADSVENYCTDSIDQDSVGALFDPHEIVEGIAYRQAISQDLMDLLHGWSRGFCPLNAIERSVSELIDARPWNPVQRTAGAVP